jgi:hypothetical protein
MQRNSDPTGLILPPGRPSFRPHTVAMIYIDQFAGEGSVFSELCSGFAVSTLRISPHAFRDSTIMATSNAFELAKRQLCSGVGNAIKLSSLKVHVKYMIVSLRIVEGKFGVTWLLRVRESGQIAEQDVFGNT